MNAAPVAKAPLPVLATMGIGSYASPGWLVAGRRHAKEEFGPDDIDEMLDDATRTVVADQIEAGLDIITDGELSRQRFVFELFSHLEGLRRTPPGRRLGVAGYDMAPHFVADAAVTAPGGLGTVEELRRLQRFAAGRHLKIALPGPLTFAAFMTAGSRPVAGVLDDLVRLVRAEIEALIRAGADYVQLDEPGLVKAPFGLSLEDCAQVINRTLGGLAVRRSLHVCFGNNAGRPMADRRIGPLLPALLSLEVEELSLELANREMAEVALLRPLSEQFEVAAGVIDVKSFAEETPERVAERVALCLAHVSAERLRLTGDCGLSALPRWLARRKIEALAAGARLARQRLR